MLTPRNDECNIQCQEEDKAAVLSSHSREGCRELNYQGASPESAVNYWLMSLGNCNVICDAYFVKN